MEMETKENDDIQEDWTVPASPIEVLQQLSKEAVRMAGEAWQVAYACNTPSLEPAPRHRRTRSEAAPSFSGRNGSPSNFQRWKNQMQKTFKKGVHIPEDSQYSFDPEILANQKRQWYQLNSKTLGTETYKEPTSLFEHFVVVGPHPDAKLEVAEEVSASGEKSEQQFGNTEVSDVSMVKHWQAKFPTVEPQVLFMYPPKKKMALRLKDLAAFCFPSGVKARILEKSPSLSELNEIVYGQEHLCRDDLSFIFSLKVAGNETLYGICLLHKVVQRPLLHGALSPLSQVLSGCSRYLVSAPRCFCILTRVPFFELHYEMLNGIIAQERLNRITKFVTEMALADDFLSPSMSKNDPNENAESPGAESFTDWINSPVPVDQAMTLPAATANIISDEEASCKWESPRSTTASETSDQCQMRDLDKDDSKNGLAFDDYTSENSESRSDSGHAPDVSLYTGSRNQSLQRPRSFESIFSPARSKELDEGDETLINHDEIPSDDMIMQWARENQNDLLQIICGYHCLRLPDRGGKIDFQPLDHLQSIEYQRLPASSLGLDGKYLNHIFESNEASQVKLKLANAEEAILLSLWSTATLCRVLSLDNILALVAGVLLEKQIVVMCPNLGVLSAAVLSLIPIIRPFEWQSLFLPILPGTMTDFLDAPVPFIVGVQNKLADLENKASNLVQVFLFKDQVKSCDLPQLPQHRELISELAPIYSKLSCEDSIALKQPVYKCNEVQAEAATQFLDVMRKYMESFCKDLRLHTITNVQSNDDKVSLLLKDSFTDSFPLKDQSFVKLFVETQLFTVLLDSYLSWYEKE